MAAATLTLTTEERALLQQLLEAALGETRVEVHHTHYAPELREKLKQDEALLRGLLVKVRT
jgi:hypothetical protein